MVYFTLLALRSNMGIYSQSGYPFLIDKFMKKIYLTGIIGKGMFTLVDDEDYGWLSKHKWHLDRYVIRSIYLNGKRYHSRMHRVIINTPEGMHTDHINGDKLDNRRENLRVCTRSENMANCGLKKSNKSGYKGVHWSKNNKNWRVQIRKDGKYVYQRYFHNILDAARAYNKVALKYHGEFARLNEL